MKSISVDVISSSDESVDTDTSHKTGFKSISENYQRRSSEVSFWEFLPFLNFTIPFISYYIIWYFFNSYLAIMIVYFYIMVPVIDMILPLDHENMTSKKTKVLEKDPKFLIPLYLYWAMDTFTYFMGLYWFTFKQFNSLFDEVVYLLTVFHIGAVGMVIGHELLHRRELVHKIFGTSFYFKVLYGHFYIEHVKGHHKHVATIEDPATSRFGESLYQFLPRTILGSYMSVWNYEKKRLARKNEGPWSFNNQLILINLGQLGFVITLVLIFGLKSLIFIGLYSLMNIVFLETVNYLEHYGLLREKDESGIYEPVNIKHSWNAPQRYTNYLLFKLQRHSDHHANAYKPYQILCSYQDSPTLPSGYSAMLLIAFCPPAWFKAVNPLVKAHREERRPSEAEVKRSQTIINSYIFILAAAIAVFLYFVL